ncbi:MAG: nitrophenyl compound nitroreductase subunit ArsF family protein [Paludibacter sp.]|nr:nitrophenyl compound nitroreductase subunit ArsF family protein [Paludibacter sp.]
MKKLLSITTLLFLSISFFAVSGIAADKKTKNPSVKSAKIEVYYFHFTRRCITCNAIENETKTSIEALYPSQFKMEQITFKSINLDTKENEQLAKKCQVEGQALLIISGSKRIDLTDKGFMYAKSSQKKWRAELKKTIDPLL